MRPTGFDAVKVLHKSNRYLSSPSLCRNSQKRTGVILTPPLAGEESNSFNKLENRDSQNDIMTQSLPQETLS
jgi:hypothetical protein